MTPEDAWDIISRDGTYTIEFHLLEDVKIDIDEGFWRERKRKKQIHLAKDSDTVKYAEDNNRSQSQDPIKAAEENNRVRLQDPGKVAEDNRRVRLKEATEILRYVLGQDQ
ncbi:hypothetical protein AYL99_12030 [Fonsecaea erecta]|uniref:Uncharacterized protein n=1 Tax=Fonsecaea erecta TaxID=1367422 RepID=A0A178Z251_9EURO|nr:hypothetical protein AYL99_12030 [Fonsecaea erecta]OAP53774.1 hypothetical protein AYL99_12030 [Fonsecaea erecta]